MDRYWLLTSTTYGTWLPGDDRGFVSNVRDGTGPEVRHDIPGTDIDARMRGLLIASRENLKCSPIFFQKNQATAIIDQFIETASFRDWELCAAAVMSNHFHIVVGVPGDPEPEIMLRDFKAYASRRLNKLWTKPESDTWWTESGSRRKLKDEEAIRAAVIYVRDQPSVLVVYLNDFWRTAISERGA